jgi:GTPase Era involved in 16S rRNA processing
MAAVIGRANVGKSTLVQCHRGRKGEHRHCGANHANLIRAIYNEPRDNTRFPGHPRRAQGENDLGKLMNKQRARALKARLSRCWCWSIAAPRIEVTVSGGSSRTRSP